MASRDGDGLAHGSTSLPSETPGNSAGDEDKIKVIPSGVLAPGEKFEIVVGKDYAGQEVTDWVFADPLKLGTFKVKANGRIALTLPADVPCGFGRRVPARNCKCFETTRRGLDMLFVPHGYSTAEGSSRRFGLLRRPGDRVVHTS